MSLENNGSEAAKAKENVKEMTVYIPVGGFMTAEYIADKVSHLAKKLHADGKHICFINLKEQLSMLHIAEEDNAEDAALMAYLLNPLKDAYQYDDIARDFLGMLIKSKADILGKADYEDSQKTYICACYNAYTAAKAYNVLMGKLDNENMVRAL